MAAQFKGLRAAECANKTTGLFYGLTQPAQAQRAHMGKGGSRQLRQFNRAHRQGPGVHSKLRRWQLKHRYVGRQFITLGYRPAPAGFEGIDNVCVGTRLPG